MAPVVWLVRHGQSVWNAEGRVQGQSDAPGLTAQGEAEARLVARRLAATRAGAVVSSDALRAVETAGPIALALGVPLRTDGRLRERCLGVLEEGPISALVPSFTGFDAGQVVDADAHPEGGESLRELYERVGGCLASLGADPPAPVFVAVTHGGFLRVAWAWLAGQGLGSIRSPRTPNTVVWRADLGTREIDGEPELPV